MCFDQLLMRAAAAAAEEDDDRAQSKGCWEGNGDQADLRQTDKQGLGGANAASLLPPPPPKRSLAFFKRRGWKPVCPLWNGERGRLKSYGENGRGRKKKENKYMEKGETI